MGLNWDRGLKALGEGLAQIGKLNAEKKQRDIENDLAARKMALLENLNQKSVEKTGTPAIDSLGNLANLKNIEDLQKDIRYQNSGYEFGLGGAPSLNNFNTARSRQELAPGMDEFTENKPPRELLAESPVAALATPEGNAFRQSIYRAYPMPQAPTRPARKINPALAKLKR